MELAERVRRFILEERLLRPGEAVLAGVSGGADSLCLLDIFHRLGTPLVVAHVDHQLRPESGVEAEFTRQVAQRYGAPALIEKADVRSRVGRGRSLEEAARLERYRVLARLAHNRGLAVLATGHTADDQAETILMHFLRGAGTDGLRGMQPSTELAGWVDLPEAAGLRLVRPLLAVSRAETVAHCASIGLVPCQDASNQDPAFRRNRLRHELLPILAGYNPRIRQVLLRTGQIMAGLSELVGERVQAEWPATVREVEPGGLRIRRDRFLTLVPAVQRGLIRRAAALLAPGLREVGWEATERGRRFVAEPPATRQADWVGGLCLRHLGGEVAVLKRSAGLVFPEYPQLAGPERLGLPIPGETPLFGGWLLRATSPRAGDLGAGVRLEDPGWAAFDADGLPAPLAVRPPLVGDRLRPFGLAGTTTVADLLVDRGIPLPARARWPVVVAGDQPVWVVGLRQAEMARVTTATRQVILLHVAGPQPILPRNDHPR